ncbi:MAG: NACHT domain-containing protein [Caldimonas sp.]
MGLIGNFVLAASAKVLAAAVQSGLALRWLADHDRLTATLAATLPRVVMVGEGGSGKSTLLKQMLARCAAAGSVPVFVSLATLPDDGPLTVSTLVDHLVEQARTRLGIDDVNHAFFEALVQDGQLAIGFDALDECGSLAQRQKVRGLIGEVAREWKRCRVFVTSRPEALLDTPLPLQSPWQMPKDESEFFSIMPLPFTRADVAPFLRVAFDDGDQLAAKLLGRTGIEALLETPLTLTLVGLVARTPMGLPETRTPLFARCLTTVCETWEDAKSPHIAADGLDPAERLDVLRRLGWEAQRGGGDTLGARTARAALTKVPEYASAARAKTIVDGLARRNLLLRAETVGDGGLEVRSIRFAHSQFREYLAAAHLAEQFALDAAASAGAMAPYWFDTGWLDVLRFAVATLEDEPVLRDALLRAALDAEDPYRDMLHRPELLVAQLLVRLPSADQSIVAQVVACLERTAVEEPALRDAAAHALLELARHAPALPAIERFARGAGAAAAFPVDEQQSYEILLEGLRWRLAAIESLSSARGGAAVLALLPARPEPGLEAALAVAELRARLNDLDGARAAWKECFELGVASNQARIAASMDKAGEGKRFNAWLLARLDASDALVGEARLARDREVLADDAPLWPRLFERASTMLAAGDPGEQFASATVSAAVYAVLETGAGAGSPQAHALMAAALQHPSLVWYVAPRVGKLIPDLATAAVQRLLAFVLDAQRLPLERRPDGSRLNVAVATLCDEPDDALAVPALLELLGSLDPNAHWGQRVAESLRRRGQAEAGLAALKPLLELPAGVDDRHQDAGAARRAKAWPLARTLDPVRTLQMLDAMYRSGFAEEDARRLMSVWNASGVGPVAREWFGAVVLDEADGQRGRRFLQTLRSHERDTMFTDEARHALGSNVFDEGPTGEPAPPWTLAETEQAFEFALAKGSLVGGHDDEAQSKARELVDLLSSIAMLSDQATALRHADAWVQQCLADTMASPANKVEALVGCLSVLANGGLREPRWIASVAAFARTLTPVMRGELVGWLNANA